MKRKFKFSSWLCSTPAVRPYTVPAGGENEGEWEEDSIVGGWLATRLAVDLSPRLGGHTCVPPTVERDRRACCRAILAGDVVIWLCMKAGQRTTRRQPRNEITQRHSDIILLHINLRFTPSRKSWVNADTDEFGLSADCALDNVISYSVVYFTDAFCQAAFSTRV